MKNLISENRAGTALVLLSLIVGIATRILVPYRNAPELAPTFVGSTAKLTKTILVPSLESPMPDHMSVIWCASLPLAWQELVKRNNELPVVAKNAEVVTGQLSAAKDIAESIPDHGSYSVADRSQQGIARRIQQEMSAKFPNARVPTLDDIDATDPLEIFAFAYLQANIKFAVPFFDLDSDFEFQDANGKKTKVKSFGLGSEHLHLYHPIREQVEILLDQPNPSSIENEEDRSQFAVDLSKDSKDIRIILAKVNREATLQETIERLFEKINRSGRSLGDGQQLLVPNFSFRLDHRFSELEGRENTILNGPMRNGWLKSVRQIIDFRLDKSGVYLRSEVAIAETAKSAVSRAFRFDRPFLILMLRRDRQTPFFAMWVDNPELMRQ